MQLIEDLDRFAKLLASVKVNGSVRALSPFEVTVDIRRMQKEGLTSKEISYRLSIRKDWVNPFLKLDKLPEELQNAVIWGKSTDIGVSFSTAKLVAQLDDPEDMRILLESAMKYKFTKVEIENIIKLKKEGTIPITECIVKVKDIKPVTEYKYMYVITVNQDTIAQLEDLSKSRNLDPSACLKAILSTHLDRKDILAAVVKGQNIAISLNAEGANVFSGILSNNKLTVGDSIRYFLGGA